MKVGDHWTYRVLGGRLTGNEGVLEMRVTFVSATAIVTVSTRGSDDREFDATWTPEWNPVVSDDGAVVSIERGGFLKFPMRVGDEWAARLEYKRPNVGSFHALQEHQVRVVGWEEITVPAGKFRALKVQTKGTFTRLDILAPTGTETYTLWYVPEVKRMVKTLYEHRAGRRETELVDFIVR